MVKASRRALSRIFFFENLTCLTQAAVKMGLSQWQRQWEASETGRTLYSYKPNVTDRSEIDFPNTTTYRNIAKLRLGYNNVEHYLLHCELYFNQREALRTHIFNTTGTYDLTSKFLLGCTKNDTRKTHGLTICLNLGDFITQTNRL